MNKPRHAGQASKSDGHPVLKARPWTKLLACFLEANGADLQYTVSYLDIYLSACLLVSRYPGGQSVDGMGWRGRNWLHTERDRPHHRRVQGTHTHTHSHTRTHTHTHTHVWWRFLSFLVVSCDYLPLASFFFPSQLSASQLSIRLVYGSSKGQREENGCWLMRPTTPGLSHSLRSLPPLRPAHQRQRNATTAVVLH